MTDATALLDGVPTLAMLPSAAAEPPDRLSGVVQGKPLLTTTKSGRPMATLSLPGDPTSRNLRGRFIEVRAFGDLAELIASEVHQDDAITVYGRKEVHLAGDHTYCSFWAEDVQLGDQGDEPPDEGTATNERA